MASYINADKLMEQLVKKKAGAANQRYTEGFNDALMRFKSMVSSARKYDSIEIVHCNECKRQETCMKQLVFWERDHVLERNTYKYHDLSFCSYGERR